MNTVLRQIIKITLTFIETLGYLSTYVRYYLNSFLACGKRQSKPGHSDSVPEISFETVNFEEKISRREQKVSMTFKYQNNKLQTNPQHCEDEKQNTYSHMTSKRKLSKATNSFFSME